jgi:NADH dehydrogenase
MIERARLARISLLSPDNARILIARSETREQTTALTERRAPEQTRDLSSWRVPDMSGNPTPAGDHPGQPGPGVPVERRPRIVVVGAGFGGLNLVKTLAPATVDITLIDRTNHNLFQPLLYQVATAALAPSDIAVPIRSVFSRRRNVRVLMGEVDGVDTVAHTVRVKETGDVPYDILVLATGSVYGWFGHDEWRAHSVSLKTLDDAEHLRLRVLGAFERAESRTDPAEIRALLTFIIVGGGPTGVELAGAIAELARSTLKRDYRHIDPTSTRVIVCEAGPRLLASFPERLSAYAERKLRALGVEVRTGDMVQDVRDDGITAAGQSIRAANVFWCAGTEATPAARWTNAAAGRHGLIRVNTDGSVPNHEDIFAIGDVAEMAGPDGKPLPALAPVAKQQGRYLAGVIRARVEGRGAPGPFRYRDYGQLAVLGRSSAVADFGWMRLRGVLAWILWSAVHLFLLLGARNKMVVYLNWVWAWLTYGSGARLMTGIDQVDGARAEAGAVRNHS